jgi:hypothetical protein
LPSIGREFEVVDILDVKFYFRLAKVGLQLGILPRGENICAHTVTQPPSISCEALSSNQKIAHPGS